MSLITPQIIPPFPPPQYYTVLSQLAEKEHALDHSATLTSREIEILNI